MKSRAQYRYGEKMLPIVWDISILFENKEKDIRTIKNNNMFMSHFFEFATSF